MSHAVVLVAIDEKVTSGELAKAVERQMEPFYEEQAWFEDGSRWDWWQIGGRFDNFMGVGNSIVRVKDFDSAKWAKDKREELERLWEEAKGQDAVKRHFMYGIEDGQTKEDYINSRVPESGWPATYAFLRDRHWHERARMGWFGMSAPTECERRADEAGVEPTTRCTTVSAKDDAARIVTWNEERGGWAKNFHSRFIKPLPPSTWLVVVDYHI